jgi:hypothetical protein
MVINGDEKWDSHGISWLIMVNNSDFIVVNNGE